MATVRYLVSDVELAIEFYTRHLGFALRRGCPGASAPCAECGEADPLAPPLYRPDGLRSAAGRLLSAVHGTSSADRCYV